MNWLESVFFSLERISFRSLSNHTNISKSWFLVERAKLGQVDFPFQYICRNHHLRISIYGFSVIIMYKNDISVLYIHINQAYMRYKRESTAAGNSFQCDRYHDRQAISLPLVQKRNSSSLPPAHNLPWNILHECVRPNYIYQSFLMHFSRMQPKRERSLKKKKKNLKNNQCVKRNDSNGKLCLVSTGEVNSLQIVAYK